MSANLPVSGKLTRGVLLMLLASCCFVGMSSAMKTLGSSVPLFEIVFIRTLVTFFATFVLCRMSKIPVVGTYHFLLCVRGVAGFASLALGFYSLTQVSLATTTALWKTSAIFAAFFARFVPSERTKRRDATLIIAGFIGVLLVLQPSISGVSTGALAALGAGCAVGVVAVFIGKLRSLEHPYTVVCAFSFYSGVCALIASGGNMVWPPESAWLPICQISLLGTIGQLLFTQAFQYGAAPVIQSFAYAEVLYSIVLGWFFFGEVPNTLAFVGMSVIIAAGVALAFSKQQ